jgi:hypothetical protein
MAYIGDFFKMGVFKCFCCFFMKKLLEMCVMCGISVELTTRTFLGPRTAIYTLLIYVLMNEISLI